MLKKLLLLEYWPIISELRMLRQDHHEFEANMRPTLQVLGQPRLYSKILFQKTKAKQNRKRKPLNVKYVKRKYSLDSKREKVIICQRNTNQQIY